MHVHTKIWIEDDEGRLLLGEGRLEILKAIERNGSLSAAARELGMSYRAVWGKIRTTEKRLGVKLVDGVAGGRQHGGAVLTENARLFVAKFDEFDRRAREAVDEMGREFLADLEFSEESATCECGRAADPKLEI